jgi:dihydrofolate synthase/folylpolyglutamate synthase
MRTLAEWLELHESTHPRSIDLGLERVAEVAARLGVGRPPWVSVIVGGTNGKGSIVAHLEALLRAEGTAVGAFTSPHLRRYNERIRINGQEASDAELIAAFERIAAVRGATSLTFFEYNTLAALELFTARGVATGILEVGLGGRLDATNLIDAEVAVLASVGFDHMDWLGPTLEDIGREKAGIFRPGRPVILANAAMPATVFEAIDRLGARAWIAGRDFQVEVAPDGDHWHYHGRERELCNLPASRLAGAVQFANAAAALAALEALGWGPRLTREIAVAALGQVSLPGRFQIVPGAVEWILDVAHNAPAAARLAAELAARPCAGRTLAVAGILADKDARAIGAALEAEIDGWVLCSLPGSRGQSAQALAAQLGALRAPVAIAEDVARACRAAREQAQAGDRIVVFGSFHTVGPALDWLGL